MCACSSSDLKLGTQVDGLSGAWRNRVSASTGWPGVSLLWLAEISSLIHSFYHSLAARKKKKKKKKAQADPSMNNC